MKGNAWLQSPALRTLGFRKNRNAKPEEQGSDGRPGVGEATGRLEVGEGCFAGGIALHRARHVVVCGRHGHHEAQPPRGMDVKQ